MCCNEDSSDKAVDRIDSQSAGYRLLASASAETVLPGYLSWRAASVAEKVKKEKKPAALKPFMTFQSVESTAAEVLEAVQTYLKSDASTAMVMPPLDAFMPADADWSGFAHFLLGRVRASNALPGPRMRIVWWKTLEELGRIPRWPDDCGHVLDAEALLEAHIREMDSKGKVDGLAPCISFFSHRWERPSMSGGAHPDSADHKKSKALASYGRACTCPIFEHHKFDYYFWIDFNGIDQDDMNDKVLGICKLPAYTASSIETIFYNSSTTKYEPRAWTRVERVLSYTYTLSPLFVYMDDKYPTEPCDIDLICAAQPDAFIKHSETGALCMKLKDPAGQDAQITDRKDLELIGQIMGIATSAIPLNPAHKIALAATGGAEPLTEPGEAGGGGHVKLGETTVMVDTEHYRLDFEAQQRVKEAINRSTF